VRFLILFLCLSTAGATTPVDQSEIMGGIVVTGSPEFRWLIRDALTYVEYTGFLGFVEYPIKKITMKPLSGFYQPDEIGMSPEFIMATGTGAILAANLVHEASHGQDFIVSGAYVGDQQKTAGELTAISWQIAFLQWWAGHEATINWLWSLDG